MAEDEKPIEKGRVKRCRERGARGMRFFKAGGMDQLCLESGEDLRFIRNLDPKLWVTLSCPTKGLEFDDRTLALIDTNGDGRIRCREVIEAVEWTLRLLKSPELLTEGGDTLPLGAIDEREADGRRLLQSARRILKNLGKPEAESITLADTADTGRVFSASKYNGDGVIPPDAAEDGKLSRTIEEIIATVGGEEDRGGKVGVSAEKIDQFFTALAGYKTSREEAREAAGTILPFGDETAPSFAALSLIEDKIEDYFAQCRLAAFDPRTADNLNRSSRELEALKGGTRKEIAEALEAFPLARVGGESALPLAEGINPQYEGKLEAFNKKVVVRVFGEGKTSLRAEDWERIKEVFSPYRKWREGRGGIEVETLGMTRVETLLESGHREKLFHLVKEDRKIGAEIEAIEEVERLLRYQRGLHAFLRNFVSLSDFYDLDKGAIFQAGRLYMDGRHFHLCVFVENRKGHAAIADKAGIYLLYCEIRNHLTDRTRTIAAAVTAGNANRLAIGKNGIFYDRRGHDWDATVVQILSHPISIREAVWMPFKRLGELVGEQFEKIAASREKSLQASVKRGISSVDERVGTGPGTVKKEGAPATAPASGGGFGGLLAGGGVAIAALSSSFAFISSTLSSIDKVYFFYTALVFLLFILLPSLLLGILKLRKRDISLILEACGWAINGAMRLNFALAARLTRQSVLPAGSRRVYRAALSDRKYGARGWIWGLLVIAAGFLLAWKWIF